MEFRDLIEAVFRLAREENPPFAIIKDLFEFIDKRRDGFIDLTEWMDAFAGFANPNTIKKRPYTANAKRSMIGGSKRNFISLNAKLIIIFNL